MAARAHVASFGDMRKRFEIAAKRANDNEALTATVSCKIVLGRYRRVQEQFKKNDDADRKRTGVGRKLTQMNEMLSMMRWERDDLDAKRAAQTKAQREKEEVKDCIGRQAVEASMSRKKRKESEGSASDGENSDEPSAKKKRPVRAVALSGELAQFGAQLLGAEELRASADQE